MTKLRPAQFSDYQAIAKLHAKSWRQNYRGIYSDKFLEEEVEQDRLGTWHKRLKSPDNNQYVIVATDEDKIVGFACIYLNDDAIFGSLLDNLHVTSELKRSGVGKLLIKEGAKYINEKCISKKMYLWVYELNENARKAYEHMGAKNVETVDKHHAGQVSAKACRYCWEDVNVFL
jgi:ribosomal protein S18 acetylase RimI-like enzyme